MIVIKLELNLTVRLHFDLPVACGNLLSGTYSEFAISGLSGGGYTAFMVGVLDTRFSATYAVAGGQPLYMRVPASEGDSEQNFPRYFEMCGWLDHCCMAA